MLTNHTRKGLKLTFLAVSQSQHLPTGRNEKHSYQADDGCSQANERAHGDDNQGQLPPLVKSQQEPADARGHALNENGHLVSNGIIDFINITGNKRGFNH